MILRELFYFDKETIESTEDDRYDPQYDDSIVKMKDSRKTRLTLRQINRARKASELHTTEKAGELDFVRQMYGIAAQAEAAGI
jgi:hypothetical protein|tara:strand:- start:2537 stop:2785 length:249 start_codon:yes stop_codon:yes gene_type:complete